MRILIFHGYLLSGTGSNVYNARLAEALVRLGHEVHLFSQDRHPERYPFVAASGHWDDGELRVSALDRSQADAAGGCTVYRPDIGGLLPLYVQDRYEGIEARTFAHCTDAEVARYVQANVGAVSEVAERVRPQVALANHLVMGPVILARGLAGVTPYAVKVHGSALEYTVKPEPERFLGYAREGLAQARTVLVGSRHTAESLWQALEDPAVAERTRLGPPGVDVARFLPREPQQARAGMQTLLGKLSNGAPAPPEEELSSAFARDNRAAATALERILNGDGDLVAFVGKLIVSKGVDLLIAAWPLVLRSAPDARLAVVGFGAYRAGLERLVTRLAEGDLQGAREIALAGRALEDGEALEDRGTLETAREGSGDAGEERPAPLRHLLAFLDSLTGAEAERYLTAARTLGERIVFTGRLDHDELADILPACEALVVPSTFPEAFGMVAVEAAACGVLPVSAGHSGLAEVSETIAVEVPPQAAGWLSFPVDDHAVRAIAERIAAWLAADEALKARTRDALVSVARERWSWEGVARGVIAAACGEPVTRPFG
ncbi:MAG TPA: glycosyltransferase family 4 protein [Solirubrobacteraceae bacterium]|nr:glycosyltransferase family 4 protein [Solirubrobacteraceae bacterium]